MHEQLAAYLAVPALARVRETILAEALPSLRLVTTSAREASLPIGATKVGGRPDLPSHLPWPRWHDRPLSFLAQINLAELPRCEATAELPSSGILCFFYVPDQSTWGYDPADAGSWRVLFDAGPVGNLARRDWPDDLPDRSRFAACAVSFHLDGYTLPASYSLIVDSWGLTAEELDAFEALPSAHEEAYDGPVHRLLGHPDQIQNDMQLECQLVSNGLYCGTVDGWDDPRRTELEPGARDWRMLFQLDSDDDAGMMWGDCGRLYFWVRSVALAHRRFDETWMISQCY